MSVETDSAPWLERARAHLLAEDFDVAGATADSVLAADLNDPDAPCVPVASPSRTLHRLSRTS